MLYFPDHLNLFFESFEEVFQTPTYLPFEYVYYIAVMTAAACDNLYVYNLFAEMFIKFGGD